MADENTGGLSEMAFRVRSSKFRHVFGSPGKKEAGFECIKITKNAHDSNFCCINTKFLAVVTESGGGGTFVVHPIEKVGRVDINAPKVCGHSGPVLDIKWNPFNEHVIASASDDATVKVWQIPEGGLRSNLTDWLVDLHGHQRRVGFIEWHPTASDLLLSAGYDFKCILWNVETAEPVNIIDCHVDTIFSISWNRDGSLFTTTCKDKKIRVVDPRSGTVVAVGDGHQGPKASKAVFLGSSNRLFTTGFSRTSDRQFAVWDAKNLSKPLKMDNIDASSGVLFPFYDHDTSVVFVAGKGDGNIRYYEITEDSPYCHYLSQFQSSAPQKGLGFLPKRGVDVTRCEIVRFYKLHTTKAFVEPISMIVPRKSEMFQDDIFPPTASLSPSLTADEWVSGQNREPILVSLKDGGRVGVARITTARAVQRKPSPLLNGVRSTADSSELAKSASISRLNRLGKGSTGDKGPRTNSVVTSFARSSSATPTRSLYMNAKTPRSMTSSGSSSYSHVARLSRKFNRKDGTLSNAPTISTYKPSSAKSASQSRQAAVEPPAPQQQQMPKSVRNIQKLSSQTKATEGSDNDSSVTHRISSLETKRDPAARLSATMTSRGDINSKPWTSNRLDHSLETNGEASTDLELSPSRLVTSPQHHGNATVTRAGDGVIARNVPNLAINPNDSFSTYVASQNIINKIQSMSSKDLAASPSGPPSPYDNVSPNRSSAAVDDLVFLPPSPRRAEKTGRHGDRRSAATAVSNVSALSGSQPQIQQQMPSASPTRNLSAVTSSHNRADHLRPVSLHAENAMVTTKTPESPPQRHQAVALRSPIRSPAVERPSPSQGQGVAQSRPFPGPHSAPRLSGSRRSAHLSEGSDSMDLFSTPPTSPSIYERAKEAAIETPTPFSVTSTTSATPLTAKDAGATPSPYNTLSAKTWTSNPLYDQSQGNKSPSAETKSPVSLHVRKSDESNNVPSTPVRSSSFNRRPAKDGDVTRAAIIRERKHSDPETRFKKYDENRNVNARKHFNRRPTMIAIAALEGQTDDDVTGADNKPTENKGHIEQPQVVEPPKTPTLRESLKQDKEKRAEVLNRLKARLAERVKGEKPESNTSLRVDDVIGVSNADSSTSSPRMDVSMDTGDKPQQPELVNASSMYEDFHNNEEDDKVMKPSKLRESFRRKLRGKEPPRPRSPVATVTVTAPNANESSLADTVKPEARFRTSVTITNGHDVTHELQPNRSPERIVTPEVRPLIPSPDPLQSTASGSARRSAFSPVKAQRSTLPAASDIVTPIVTLEPSTPNSSERPLPRESPERVGAGRFNRSARASFNDRFRDAKSDDSSISNFDRTSPRRHTGLGRSSAPRPSSKVEELSEDEKVHVRKVWTAPAQNTNKTVNGASLPQTDPELRKAYFRQVEEIKALREQISLKDKRIRQLETEVSQLREMDSELGESNC